MLLSCCKKAVVPEQLDVLKVKGKCSFFEERLMMIRNCVCVTGESIFCGFGV